MGGFGLTAAPLWDLLFQGYCLCLRASQHSGFTLDAKGADALFAF